MSAATFRKDGIERVKTVINEIPRNKAQFIKDTLKELGDLLLKNIKQGAPSDSGDYARSWKVNAPQGNKVTLETPEGLLFDILEFQGRRAGRINKKTASVLAFKWRGQDAFFAFVDHPGFKEIPHVRPAIRKTMKEANRIIFKNLSKNMRIFK